MKSHSTNSTDDLKSTPNSSNARSVHRVLKSSEQQALENMSERFETFKFPEQPPDLNAHLASKILRVQSATALLNNPPPRLQFIVKGMLPVGVTLLCARPKEKKSFLAMSTSIAVATNQKAFGAFGVSSGDVLYIDADMASEARFHKRLTLLLNSDDTGSVMKEPDRLTYTTKRTTIADGLIAGLESWAAGAINPRLIVIDTYGAVRFDGTKGRREYNDELRTIGLFKAVAFKYNLAVLIVHHTANRRSSGGIDDVLGSTGLAAAVDNAWVIQTCRRTKRQFLNVKGRDQADQKYVMEFDCTTGEFELTPVDDDDEFQIHTESIPNKVVAFVAAQTSAVHRKDIVTQIGNRIAVDTALSRLVKDGVLQRGGNGFYQLSHSSKVVESQVA